MQKRLQKLLLIMVTVFVPWIIQAQSLGDYTFSTGVDTTKWIDMSSATQILTPSNNDGLASSLQSIGFTFRFGAGTYTQYSVNTDGNLRLGHLATGTLNYSWPFSATNANNNNPKINAFGCDGYGLSGSHYVKSLLTVDANGDTMLVVEYCLGTYNSTTRSNLYKWQVHLYATGDIEMVYGAAPAAAPNIARQPGLCVNSSDGWTIDESHNATHFTAGVYNNTVSLGVWPTEGRYYRFASPSLDCPKPVAITASNIGTASFDISWTDTSTAASWIVRLFDGDSMIYDNEVFSNSASFTGLNAATYYAVQVAGLCTNGDTSAFQIAEVLTSCALLTSLPYTQNFDGVPGSSTERVSTNNLPPCWANYNAGTESNHSGHPIVYNNSIYAHSGTNAMRFYYYISWDTSDQIAIMPPTDSTVLPLSALQVSFWMRAHTDNHNSFIIVGVMSDPTNTGTFVPVDTVYTNSSMTYAQHTVLFSAYNGSHGSVAFRARGVNYLYIDDIVLDEIPTCLPVSNLMVTGVNDGSISLSWSPTGSETSWIVSDGTNDYMASDTVYTLTGLSATTTYLISVRAYCDGDTSAAVAVTATTTCGVITALPFVENFDGVTGSTTTSLATNNLPSCWSNYNTGTNTSYSGYPIVYSNSTYAHSGTNCMRFFNNGQAHFSDQIAVMPMTDSLTLPLQGLQVSFWLKDAGLNSLVVGVMTDPTDRTTFVAVDTISTNGSSTYGQHTVRLDSYNGPHGRVAFMAPQGSAGFVYNIFVIDDVVLESSVCQPVQNLTALNIAPNSVDVRWTETGIASTWYVTYMPAGYSLDSAVTLVAHDTTVTITGLAANTDYTVMVVANCGSLTSDTGVVTFHTPCNYITSLPYVENFDGVTGSSSMTLATNNLPACWGYYNTGTSPSYSGYPIVYSSSTYAHSGTNAMRFNTYFTADTYSDQIAAMPMTDPTTLPVSGLQISFWTRSTSASYNSFVIVGVMGNPTDAATFVPIDTVRTNGSTAYTNHTVMLGRYAGPHGHIAFKVPQPASSYNALMIDDITINYMPACPDVVGLTITHVTPDSIGIAWLPMGSETTWLVSDGINQYVTNNTVFTFGGLRPGTFYTLSVRPICTTDTGNAVTVTTHTACGPLTVMPYIDNLDSYVGITTLPPSENNLPLCWGYINHGTRNNYKDYPILYNNYANSEGNCIRYYSHANYADSNQYLILPMTDSLLFPLNTIKVSFAMRAGNTSSTYKAEAIVGLITNPLDARTFVPIDTVNSNGVSTYSRYEVDYSNYNGPHGNIALMFPTPRGSGFNQNSGYVDDFVIEVIPDCPPVINLAVANTVADTAMLVWSDTASNTSWIVEYGISGFTRGMGTTITTNDTSLILTDLAINTAYDVYVTPDCAGNAPGVAFLTFRTECGMIESFPYIEDFESYNIGSPNYLPPYCGIPCWHRLDNSTSNHLGYIGNISQWPAGGRSGSRFLYYYFPPTGTAYGDWAISALPPVNTALHPVNTLKFSFWAKMDNTSAVGSIVVGVMTDPTVDTTFVPVDTVSVYGILYTKKEIDLSSYNGTGAYIAMRLTRSTSAISYYFIDDIMIEQIPVCSPVENITLVGADTTELILSWLETGTATSWRVEYGVSGVAPDSGIAVTATSLPFTIRRLSPATSYDIYVTPICAEGTSTTRNATFRTATRRFAVPFVCDFEDTAQNRQWVLENGENHNRWHIGTATNNGGTQSLYITNDNGISNNYTAEGADAVDYAYADVTLTTPGDYGYTFDWKCEGESHYDFLRAALIPISEQLTASTSMPYGLTLATMPASWLPLDGGHKLNLQTSWQTRSDVAEVTTDGDYHLAFVFRCNNINGSMPPPAIDNISLAYSPCTRPDSVVLSNLTQTSADFSWHERNSATVWQYQLDSGDVTTVYTNHASFAGLTANTPHTFKVRSICGIGDTSFWRVYDFHTPCSYLSVLPYYQDFEAEATGSSTSNIFVNCWTRLNNGISYFGYPYVSSGSHTFGDAHSLYWYSSTTYGTYGDYQCISLPPVDTAIDVAALQLSFWMRASARNYVPKLMVGVMTDPDNVSTFEAVDTIAYTGGTFWGEVVVPLSTYTGDGRFVAIKAERDTGYWYAYIDDLTLDYITTCFVPTIIYATNTTASSITLDWVDITPTTQWQVEYGPQGYTRGTSDGTLVTTSSHPVVISGLDYLTSYDFYVRPICSEDDSARWGYPTTLMTGMCDYSTIATTGYATSTGTNYRYPVNNYYNYSLTETIIDSAELGGEMNIEYISYYYDHTSPMTDKANCTIYIQPTTLSAFSNASAAVALNPATAVRVYTGSLNCSQGWNYFPLDTVYHYDGTGNLMVIVDDNSGDYSSSSYTFKTEPCTGNKTLYYYSDTYNPDVTNPSSFAGSKYIDSSRVVMQLISCSEPACRRPEITNIAYTHESATITWTGDGTYYEVNIKEAEATEWPIPDIAVSGNTYTFTGLLPTTGYTFRVRQDCNIDTLGYSEWVGDSFVTDSMPCFAPDSLHVTAVTNTTATFDWAPISTETAWNIHVWFTGGLDTVYTVSTHPATVGGFTAGVTYQAAVRPLCGLTNDIVGRWSDTITFATTVCPDVTGLYADNVTSNSVTLHWDNDPMAQSWIIEYGYQGFDQGTGTVAISSINSYTVNGLLDDMDYDFMVRAVCGDNWQSEGVASVTATTQAGTVICDAPIGVSAVVAGNAATVSWMAGAGNISFQLEYGTRGFAHGAGTTITANASPATLSGLNYETEYDVYVKAYCGGDVYSAWSTVASFTTEPEGSQDCDPVTDLAASNVTENSALISWTPGTTGDEWEVVLADASGVTISEASTTERQYLLNGLTPGTAYIAKVRTVCGDEQYSTFVSTSFTTASVGIDNVEGATCAIYPNPTSGATTITVNGVSGKVKIAVVDINGREVASETLNCSGDCAKTMDVDRLAQGAYFVRITGENVSMVRKLIVR